MAKKTPVSLEFPLDKKWSIKLCRYTIFGKIKGVTYFSHFIIPKDDLIAFLTSAYGNKIVNKSKAHTKLIDAWKRQFELLHTQSLHDMISSDTET